MDGKLLAVASFGSGINLWQIPSGELLPASLGDRYYQSLSLAFAHQKDLLAVGSGWSGVRLWQKTTP
jgi:hypothetical protein